MNHNGSPEQTRSPSTTAPNALDLLAQEVCPHCERPWTICTQSATRHPDTECEYGLIHQIEAPRFGVRITLWRAREDGKLVLQIDGPEGNAANTLLDPQGQPVMRIWLNEGKIYDNEDPKPKDREGGRSTRNANLPSMSFPQSTENTTQTVTPSEATPDHHGAQEDGATLAARLANLASRIEETLPQDAREQDRTYTALRGDGRATIEADRVLVMLDAVDLLLDIHTSGTFAEPGKTPSPDPEVTRLRRVIERDRTLVGMVATSARRVLGSYRWVAEGRGPYEWDDDRYRAEFGHCVRQVTAEWDKLGHLIGDWSDCPMGEELQAVKAEALDTFASLRGSEETSRDLLEAFAEQEFGPFWMTVLAQLEHQPDEWILNDNPKHTLGFARKVRSALTTPARSGPAEEAEDTFETDEISQIVAYLDTLKKPEETHDWRMAIATVRAAITGHEEDGSPASNALNLHTTTKRTSRIRLETEYGAAWAALQDATRAFEVAVPRYRGHNPAEDLPEGRDLAPAYLRLMQAREALMAHLVPETEEQT